MNGRISGSKKGQMPFAMIAVTLLLVGGMYGAVCAMIEDSTDNSEKMSEGIAAIDESMSETERFVESGIGRMIEELSTSMTGTIQERCDEFDLMFDGWMSMSFPRTDRGITAYVTNDDVSMSVKMLGKSGDELFMGSKPMYLSASGTMTIDFASSIGEATRTLDINADGTSGLPFLIDNASMFESYSEGNGSLLTQMVDYQLTALAQQRVLSGFGATSEYGEWGTRSIITEDDAERAVKSSLTILETLCFRSNSAGDMELVKADKVDAAEYLMAEDGYIVLDMAAVFAQTILSIIDTLALQWLDYFGMDEILDFISDAVNAVMSNRYVEKVIEYINIGINFFKKLFRIEVVEMPVGAYDYLSYAMCADGRSESDFRYLLNGKNALVTIPGGVYVSESDGESYSVSIPEMTIEVPYPNVDISTWSGWGAFEKNNDPGKVDLVEYLRGLIKSIAIDLTAATDIGIVRIPVDAFDDNSFSEEIGPAVEKALIEGRAGIERSMEGSIKNGKSIDPYMSSLYREIDDNSDSIFQIGVFEESLSRGAETAVRAYIAEQYGNALDPELVERIVSDCSGSMDEATDDYRNAVSTRLGEYERTLTSITVNNQSIIKDVIVKISKFGMDQLNVYPAVYNMMDSLCQESISYLSSNPESDITELSGLGEYTISNERNDTYSERIQVSRTDKISVKITDCCENGSKNIHYTDLNDDCRAAFSSVINVAIKANISYTIESTTDILSALGISDGTFSGTMDIDTNMDVVCMSGWALTGADYTSSRTILDDVWSMVLKAIEPLIEPLKRLFEMTSRIFEMCSSVMMEISEYMTSMVTAMLETIMEPLEQIRQFIEDDIGKAVADFLIESLNISLTRQSVTIQYYGMELTLKTNLASLAKSTKSVIFMSLTKTIGDTKITSSLDVKQNSKGTYLFLCKCNANSSDWKIDISMDPLMQQKPHMVEVSGYSGNIRFDAVMPELVQYEVAEIKASDIEVLDKVLSSIPVPVPGMKGSIDMGLVLKYDVPMKTGLMINEFESNPRGDDVGFEWVELYNASSTSIDLNGYVLVPGSGEKKSMTIEDCTVGPWCKEIFFFPKQALNNSSRADLPGERISLLTPDGVEIDRTPWKQDSNNSEYTWQRIADGYSEWMFMTGTPGASNGGVVPGGMVIKATIIDCVSDSAFRALDDVGGLILNIEQLAQFMELTIKYTIAKVIDKIASCLISASVFFELELTDLLETQHYGVRISLEVGSDLIKDGLNWMLGQIPILSKYIDNPAGMTAKTVLAENIELRTTVFAEITTPEFLMKSDDAPGIKAGVTVSLNLSAIGELSGNHCGRWSATIGVVFEDVPAIAIPKIMEPDAMKNSDLWLLRVTFERMP